jgi:predicted transcriptional regulator
MMLRVAKDLEVLMSIHEEWADLILKGTKRWEFKRKCALSPGMGVWIYSTAPRREIVGFFTIGEIRRVSARRPDPSLARDGALTVAQLRNYLTGLDFGFAIEVTHRRRVQTSIRLSKGRNGPESYRYLYPDGPDASLVRRLAHAALVRA